MSFSVRLKEERKRLRLTQPELAAAGGTTKGSQLKYEKGENPANSQYLELIAKVGVDIQYLLTGVRSDMALTPEEKHLLALYREALQPLRKAAIAALASGGQIGASGQSVTIGGDNTGVVAGDNMTIHVREKRPRGSQRQGGAL